MSDYISEYIKCVCRTELWNISNWSGKREDLYDCFHFCTGVHKIEGNL